jgi:CheY-like chemotaxis protein
MEDRRYSALAVDDDADTYALIRLVLAELPIHLAHAPTGAAAIDHLTRAVPDLILLDLNLPDMRGWDLLDRFKADERLADTQVVILTSHAEPVHRLIGLLQPISAYLRKPVDADTLRAQVRELLRLE